MISDARLDQPVLVDAGTATRMVRPYTWLLDRVGDGGINLTGAGYLPPVHVEAAVADLSLGNEWIGKGNRENQTLPVLDLRESATSMGLLRHGALKHVSVSVAQNSEYGCACGPDLGAEPTMTAVFGREDLGGGEPVGRHSPYAHAVVIR